MKLKRIATLVLGFALLLCGCHQEEKTFETRPPDVEPTASYDWMAGESPVANKRIGLKRISLTSMNHAVSPNGAYFIEHERQADSRLCYMDNGSDRLIPLCGRADCSHNNSDCNAAVSYAEGISFRNGYLYVMCGSMEGSGSSLIRMEPDGSNHVEVLDLLDFASEHGGETATCVLMTEGYFFFKINRWNSQPNEYGGISATQETIDYYYCALDSSMDEPQVLEREVSYNCGDMIFCYSPIEAQNGGESGSAWEWDPETNTSTYLTDHPGVFSYFSREAAYYFNEGKFYRLDYATGNAEILFETELEGRYSANLFPDCILLAARDEDMNDNTFYIYNWEFEFVDAVKLKFPHSGISPELTLLSETAERFILTDSFNGDPL